MKNPKDTISSICGIITGFCALLLASTLLTELPKWVPLVCTLIVMLCNAVTSQLVGKNSDLSTKTDAQVTGEKVEAPKAGDPTVTIKS